MCLNRKYIISGLLVLGTGLLAGSEFQCEADDDDDFDIDFDKVIRVGSTPADRDMLAACPVVLWQG